jgi:ribonucleoside-diphosphate reductase beta chain|tara:strand:+ start:10459 stop:11466 length:1008 start_codon:yes stop_codon:yes gene_type:complete
MKKTNEIISDKIAAVNQILPHTNKWAWDLFIDGAANNWMPTEISMAKDIEQWKSDLLSEDERLVVKRCMGFFAGSESLVANNLLLSIFKYVTDPECRQYILRQAYEESLHNLTVVYCCDSLNLDVDEVYQAYNSIPSIKAKDKFLMNISTDINRPDFNINTLEGKRELLRNLITFYVICEGIFFFSGFAMLLSFNRQNKLPGVGEQIQYTLRDESLHIKFGMSLISHIRSDNPKIWTKAFEQETLEHIETAMELEVAYAREVLPNGILGLNSDMFINYVQYIANRRLEGLDLPAAYGDVQNPFPWMSEIIDLEKCKNFFETRVTEYSVGTLQDDF